MFTRDIYHNRDNVKRIDYDEMNKIAEKAVLPEGHLNLAVSGGADSVALMCIVYHLGRTASVHHVNHGIRDASNDEAKIVQELAENFQFDFFLYETTIGFQNMEENARQARQDFLPEDVLTAHSFEDKVETVIMNFMRGATSKGFSPMTDKPLINITANELDSIVVYYDVSPCVDSTNFTQEHVRNRVRHELIPLMTDISGTNIAKPIIRNSQIALEESEYLDQIASKIDITQCKTAKTENIVILRRATRMWIEENISHKYSEVNITNLVSVVQGETLGTQIAGKTIRRQNNQLHIL